MSTLRCKGEMFASQRPDTKPCYYEGQSIERVNENECNFPVKSIKDVTSFTVIGKE